MTANDLNVHPIHLGLGASASVQPTFTGKMDWYEAYAARHASDGAEGRLVALHSMTASWGHWEMHPLGSEVVLCTAGAFTLLQEGSDGRIEKIALGAGQYAINEPGIWHTADVEEAAMALFITAGQGTQHRPR